MTTDTSVHHDDHGASSRAVYGFWVFLLSDLIMFSALFASYAVLRNNTFGGIGIQGVATLPYILVMTIVLIASSFTAGLSSAAFDKGSKCAVMFWLLVTLVITIVFIGMEQHQFASLIHSGNTWQRSAFLSAFFTLTGLHWFHVVFAAIWVVVLLIQFMGQGLTAVMRTRVTCLAMFFHFLNILWMFIFVIVYLMGAI